MPDAQSVLQEEISKTIKKIEKPLATVDKFCPNYKPLRNFWRQLIFFKKKRGLTHCVIIDNS